MNSTWRNRLVAGALTVATAAGMLIGAGTASADDTLGRLDDRTCQGVSPNIVDLPYSVGIRVQQTQKPIVHNSVTLYLTKPVTFLAPYSASGTLTWRNPVSGQHGSQRFSDTIQRYQLLMPFIDMSSMPTLYLHPGVGPLDVSISAQPKGLVPVAPVTCTVRFTVI